MDGPHKKPPTIQSDLAGRNAEDDQQVPIERVKKEIEARDQRVLIKGHKPRLTTVGIPRGNCQGKAIGQLILSLDPFQVIYDQTTVNALTA